MKERKYFTIADFRGLDTETRPSLVNIKRATDGKNFVFDSGVLRTRPAIVGSPEIITSVLDPTETIVDWYDYGEIRVYVTTKHLYFFDGTLLLNEQPTENIIVNGPFNILNFEGLSPVFQEEKECLFIFCLNLIVVFSVLDADTPIYILYELRTKPTVVPEILSGNDEAILRFENLPTPYVPTVYLDEKGFEDVNLLSNEYRYKLFAANPFTKSGHTIYRLPTNYNETKHGVFTEDNWEVLFYDNVLANKQVLPVHLGIEGEDFEVYDPMLYGLQENADNPYIVEDEFSVVRPFEYREEGDDELAVITPIREIAGISREWIFTATEKNSLLPVLKLMLNKIKDENYEDNVGVAFQVKIKYEAIYYDATTNNVKRQVVETRNVIVWIMVMSYERRPYSLDNPQRFLQLFDTLATDAFSRIDATVEDYPVDQPAFSSFLGNINNQNINETNAETIIAAYVSKTLFEKIDAGEFAGIQNDKVILSYGTIYSTYSVTIPTTFTVSESGWLSSGPPTEVTLPRSGNFPWIGFPAYPSVAGNLITAPEPFHINEPSNSEILIVANAFLQDYYSVNNAPNGDAWVRFRVYYIFNPEDLPDQWEFNGLSYCVPYNAIVSYAQQRHKRWAYDVFLTYNSEEPSVTDGIYEFGLDPNDSGTFRLIVKDLFFDFNNEPSIKVNIKFSKNEDYNIIARTRFGTNFGGENRLFLAGHEDYPNIDRYNISNDLLGDNVKSQSYELSYFPSKNLRVVGGKSAINGYTIATDNTLFITKEKGSNDTGLYVRTRNINENGLVSFFEQRTSVNKSPINKNCLVRFLNDILILTTDGLFGIELSGNVITDERLLRLRSAFVNNLLKASIAQNGASEIFMVEDNERLYIVVGNEIYYADNRYMSKNEHGVVDNAGYEIVRWEFPREFSKGKIENGFVRFLLQDKREYYVLASNKSDEIKSTIIDGASCYGQYDGFVSFNLDSPILSEAVANLGNTSFSFARCRAKIASNVDFEGNLVGIGYVYTIKNILAFSAINDGDVIYATDDYITFEMLVISGLAASNYQTFTTDKTDGYIGQYLFVDASYRKLYVKLVINYTSGSKGFLFSIIKPETVSQITQNSGESNDNFEIRASSSTEYNQINFFESTMFSVVVFSDFPIELLWASAITNFGSDVSEKTMFKTGISIVRADLSNAVKFGYKTMRNRSAEGLQTFSVPTAVDLGNFDMQSLTLTTTENIGMNLPIKENNFLYIRFLITASGIIEIDSVKILYKVNRMLKTIG